ncbi:hypothetical protein D9M69_701440 [compost metagenome]
MHRSVRRAIKTPDRQRLPLHLADALRQAADGVEIDQLYLGYIHAHHAGNRHHRELVLGHAAILLRRQLHDP